MIVLFSKELYLLNVEFDRCYFCILFFIFLYFVWIIYGVGLVLLIINKGKVMFFNFWFFFLLEGVVWLGFSLEFCGI